MIIYKEEMVSHKSVDKVRCDICKKEYEGLELEEKDPDEKNAYYYSNMVEMQYKEGRIYSFYECYENEGQKMEIEICPSCFKEVVLPFLVSKGLDKKWESFEY